MLLRIVFTGNKKFKQINSNGFCSFRHELPILDTKIHIVHETEDVLIVDKPCSIPVHACGRYHCNSLTFLLQRQLGYSDLRCKCQENRKTLIRNFF